MPKIIINGEVVNFGQSGGGTQTVSDSYIINAPIGVIVQWSGTVNTVPDGWAVCDGTNGTLDLRDKFVLAAGDTHSVGEIGGSEEVTLTAKQIPSHTHTLRYYSSTGNQTTSETSLKISTGEFSGVSTNNRYNANVLNQVGSSESHSNMPPYYTLLFIQKIGVTPSDYVTEKNFQTSLENLSNRVPTKTSQLTNDSGFITGETYSTNEMKIGTWIDGKPLYRKCVTFTSGTTIGQHRVASSIFSFDVTIIKLEALLYGTATAKNSTFVNGYYAANDSHRFNLFYYNTDRSLYDNIEGSGFMGASGLVILEYTKN